jgi:hypothetical protein
MKRENPAYHTEENRMWQLKMPILLSLAKQNIWIFDMLLQYCSALFSEKITALAQPAAE